MTSSCQVHTLTYDNGKEFAYHMEIAKVLKANGYFAHPYHSWERGLNENTNGLIRQYLPKGTDFNKLTDKQVLEIMDKLNNRPRKCLVLLCHISDSRRRQAAKASCLRRCRS